MIDIENNGVDVWRQQRSRTDSVEGKTKRKKETRKECSQLKRAVVRPD